MKKLVIVVQIIIIVAASSFLGFAMNKLRLEPFPMAYSHEVQDESVGLVDINSQELSEIADKNGTVFVDARDSMEFSMGHIPGAISIPSTAEGDILKDAVAKLNANATVVVYCDGLTCGKSKIAGEKLLDLGFKDVRVYPDGLDGWLNLGKDLEAQ